MIPKEEDSGAEQIERNDLPQELRVGDDPVEPEAHQACAQRTEEDDAGHVGDSWPGGPSRRSESVAAIESSIMASTRTITAFAQRSG